MSNKTPGVQVATCTATQLLRSGGLALSPHELQTAVQGQLCIPEYQRPYRWQDKQIRRLLADMAEHRRLEEAREAGARKKGEDFSPIRYYLGSAILHRDAEGKLNIIDGQQRITTLALLGQMQAVPMSCSLEYRAPTSQQQIKRNLQWLRGLSQAERQALALDAFDFEALEFTLVVTDSEDEAYAFFETQNTGGVRLSGPDIIKAHHLRAVAANTVNDFALRWEAMGDLNPVVDAVLRGRYWRRLDFRTVPAHNQETRIRTEVVSELAERTGRAEGEDKVYGRVIRTRRPDGGEEMHTPMVGYELRQPLNSGANTIHYLQYFEGLRQKYLVGPMSTTADRESFPNFYHQLVCTLDGCGYLKQLFDACVLVYVGQFGERQLYRAAVKIFRVVYSRRVENRKAVRELSVSSFVKEVPVLDWITQSYTPEQCFSLFDGFELQVNKDGLEANKKGVKMSFVEDVSDHFELGCLPLELTEKEKEHAGRLAKNFATLFSEKVRTV